MSTRLLQAKDDLLLRAAELGERSRSAAGDGLPALDLPGYLRLYYRHVAPEDLLDRDPADVLGAALSHWQLAQQRPWGTERVRVLSPTVEEHGWSSPHTVVEVVTDDMSFLVDSVNAALTRESRGIHLVVHPVVQVRRDAAGSLRGLAEAAGPDAPAPEGPDAPDGTPGEEVVESWMHVEIDRDSDRADLTHLDRALTRVLHDVREAVEDWPRMRAATRRIAEELAASGDADGGSPAGSDGQAVADADEVRALLDWLLDDHFTFLGYREYALSPSAAEGTGHSELVARPMPGTGLGLLRDDSAHPPLPEPVGAPKRAQQLLSVTKADSRSTVHRNAYPDVVAVRRFDERGDLVGERRLLGLFTSPAYLDSVRRVPVVRRKVAALLERSGFPPDSHSGKDLLQVLETYPRDELFQADVEEIEPVVLAVLGLQERRQVRVFFRRDERGRYLSCLVYLPRDRYVTAVRRGIERILGEAFAGATVDYGALVSESVLARLHFVVRARPGRSLPEVDLDELDRRLVQATRSWDDDFVDALLAGVGEEEAARLLRSYASAFPEAYKEDVPPRVAVADLRRLDALESGALAVSLYAPPGAGPGHRRFKLFHTGPVSLAQMLPILQQLGVEVLDERPYELVRADGARFHLYDFGLRYEPAEQAPELGGQPGAPAAEAARERFSEAFTAVWAGEAENDGFNALVLRADLTWRQAALLRAYARYLRQAGTTFSQVYIEAALLASPGIARLLVRLFETRFDPRVGPAREARSEALVQEITAALDEVASLDQDRILRGYLTVIRATLRTNYFRPRGAGEAPPCLSLKLDPLAIPDLPLPRPRFEIFVHSPRVEGVHLRFGPVARGGLRWSDRREDYRTEVLGLVKAQVVKNAVIVPTGAKGGFVVKRPPADPTDREAVQAEGVACYRRFVSGLLEVTDNLVEGAVVPPPGVVRHDGDDAYLVVAADKGTATFSDLANAIAMETGFWLGDAFASGGSSGYDHKAMGITARGAWESVRRHFRELGRDVQAEAFTVVGIGDMSGDVFGNGMLLSEHIRLVAAFDHRHVFLDPDPDPVTSYAERRRLFDTPRSSWADYDPALLSPGGGVYPRTAKSVPVSEQARRALGLPEHVSALTPAELIRAVLTAPVDLLWNGGVGTYVRSTGESDAEVGDRANDAVRVTGAQLRARVVGEGGNLGFTQRGRVEYALGGWDGTGGRINTDAIDNSAGVDTSDHEVNLKILLDRVVREGDLTGKQRDALLAQMTEDVAAHVLRDNYEQNVLLATARAQAAVLLPVHRRLIATLEAAGTLDRAVEFLPSDATLDARAAAGRGLTSPELAVLSAYGKNALKAALLATGLPDEPWFGRTLRSYFPRPVVDRYGERLPEHPLRREIITTRAVNDLVNRAGITFVHRAADETAAEPAEVARAYTVVREVFALEPYWSAIEALDDRVPTAVQTLLSLQGRRLLDRSTRWLLHRRRSAIDVSAEVGRFSPIVAALVPAIPDLLLGEERERLYQRVGQYEAAGVPTDLAVLAAGLLDSFSLLDVVEVAEATGLQHATEEVARTYFALSERFGVDRLLTRITALPREDRWASLARSALRYDLYAALAGLTADVLTSTDPAGSADPQKRIAAWEQANAEGLARATGTLAEVMRAETSDLAALSVALRAVRTLLGGG